MLDPSDTKTSTSEASGRKGLLGLLMPAEPRSFFGQRWLKITLRAIHVLCAGTLVGAFAFEVPQASRTQWLIATAISGAALLLLDLIETSAFFLQLRGWVIAVKIGTLCLLPSLGAGSHLTLAAIVLVSVMMSHAPSRVRYKMPFGAESVRGSESKG